MTSGSASSRSRVSRTLRNGSDTRGEMPAAFEDLDLGQGRDADDRDLLDAEADGAGEDMMGLAVGLTQRLDMPAEHEAGAAREPEEAEDEPGAEKARQAALERDGDRAPAPEPRPGEEAEEADRGQLGARARRNGRAAGDAGAQRSYEASSTIHLTNSPNEKPAWAAISGTKLVSVMPGCVLTSSTTSSPVPPGVSSYLRSARLTPRQPSA